MNNFAIKIAIKLIYNMFINTSLADYLAQYNIVWAEDLPANTPPNDIVFAEGMMIIFLDYLNQKQDITNKILFRLQENLTDNLIKIF